MARATRIAQLLLIDDVKLTRLLSGYLHERGLSVSLAHDGASGLRLALSGDWDLILLDGLKGLKMTSLAAA